jgi:hypothetical protein
MGSDFFTAGHFQNKRAAAVGAGNAAFILIDMKINFGMAKRTTAAITGNIQRANRYGFKWFHKNRI